MDPQQRLLLEVRWEALEHAGQAPDRLSWVEDGRVRRAVHERLRDDPVRSRPDAAGHLFACRALAHSIASGRVSYVLGLHGPSISLDTACSSSLVAVHLACQSLRAEECRLALAGGVHLILSPENSVAFSRTRMLAPDGRCKTSTRPPTASSKAKAAAWSC